MCLQLRADLGELVPRSPNSNMELTGMPTRSGQKKWNTRQDPLFETIPMTAHLVKYSVPDCGILTIFHTRMEDES